MDSASAFSSVFAAIVGCAIGSCRITGAGGLTSSDTLGGALSVSSTGGVDALVSVVVTLLAFALVRVLLARVVVFLLLVSADGGESTSGNSAGGGSNVIKFAVSVAASSFVLLLVARLRKGFFGVSLTALSGAALAISMAGCAAFSIFAFLGMGYQHLFKARQTKVLV